MEAEAAAAEAVPARFSEVLLVVKARAKKATTIRTKKLNPHLKNKVSAEGTVIRVLAVVVMAAFRKKAKRAQSKK